MEAGSLAALTVQRVLGAIAPRLSIGKQRNLVLFKGQAGSSTSSPSQGCCHTEILGVWRRSPLPELQTTARTRSSHSRTPASAPAPAAKNQRVKPRVGNQSGWSSQGEGSGNRQVLATGHSPTKGPLSPKQPRKTRSPTLVPYSPAPLLWALLNGYKVLALP